MSILRFFFLEAWEMQQRDRASGFASLTALTAVLFLLAIVLIAGHNIRGAARSLESRKGIEVFLADGVSEERIRELAGVFEGFGEVSAVQFVSEDEALREVEQDLGGIDVVNALGENPLVPSFQIELIPRAAARAGIIQELASEIEQYEGVDEVLYGGSWIDTLEKGLRNIYLATAGTGILAAVAVLLVLWNTIKLAFMRRLDTIRLLKAFGATPTFIRTPYLMLGSLHAAFASILALLLSAVASLALSAMIPGLRFLPLTWVLIFLGGTILLGLASSIASVEPALRTLERHHETFIR